MMTLKDIATELERIADALYGSPLTRQRHADDLLDLALAIRQLQGSTRRWTPCADDDCACHAGREGHGVTGEHFGGDVDAYNAWVARHTGG